MNKALYQMENPHAPKQEDDKPTATVGKFRKQNKYSALLYKLHDVTIVLSDKILSICGIIKSEENE